MQNSEVPGWQNIGWNGLSLHIPAAWDPTVIYPTYLFFEENGRAVFEVKWQKIKGKFAPEKSLDQIRKSFKDEVSLHNWDIPSDLQHLLPSFSISGFELQHEKNQNKGMILYCPECESVTLVQWYLDTDTETELLGQILSSFRDHTNESEQVWSIYDIKAVLPVAAELTSHEFLPGRYTLCFDLVGTQLTLYRFKPAAILLEKKSVGEFGKDLLSIRQQAEGNGWASWKHKAEGIELLLAKLRRKPVWHWMRLWYIPEQNVILGVKAEGKRLIETGWLDTICENFSSLQSQ